MIRPATALYGYQLLASDGAVGEINDFLFDDDCWKLRYFVVDAGRWLAERHVIIAPEAVQRPEWDAQRLPTPLSKEQVRQSPQFDPTQPLTTEVERQLRQHYGWSDYALPAGSTQRLPIRPATDQSTEAVTPAVIPGAGADAEMVAAARGAQEAQEVRDRPQLRSAREVIGYHVQASDGDVGHVEDLLIDDTTWEIRFIVVDTRNWWPGKKVVLSPQSIANISWPESHVVVNLTRDDIQNARQYDPADQTLDDEAANRRRTT